VSSLKLTSSVVVDLAGVAQGTTVVPWEPFREGVEIHRLYLEEGGSSAVLLRYQKGASIPAHEHHGYEHIFVIQGSQTDSRGTHREGSMVINPPGTHHVVRSPEGCIVLVIWERPVVFLDEDA
jgi:anti-sigma factor ChrR (cupin superfamily)